jgi:mRNA-binding protein PUF3
MPSETIWSGNNDLPIQSNTPLSSTQYGALGGVDPQVVKLLDPMTEGRKFSFGENDFDHSMFGLKKGSLSAMTDPVGVSATVSYSNNNTTNPSQRLNFGTASISGGIASRHPPQEGFLQKFSTVADATKEIELSNGFGKLTLDNGSRRTSFNDNSIKLGSDLLTSPHGSLNESLNIPVSRTSRHQSISEKIDNYNNNSPIQASATLSISSDLNNPNTNSSNSTSNKANIHDKQNSTTFWNPANASSFTPANYGYFVDNQLPGPGPVPIPPPYNYGRNGPINSPPFMVPQAPLQFMDPGLYNLMGYGAPNPEGADKEDSNTEEPEEDEQVKSNRTHQPGGVGLMNRQFPPASFMFPNFTPYPMYQQSRPPMGIAPSLSPPPLDHLSQPVFENNQNKRNGNNSNFNKNSNGGASTGNSNSSNSNGNGANNSSNSNSKRKNARNGNSSAGKGANHIYRSPLLEEIRSNTKGKEYYLKNIYGHAVEFTKDQHGSRFIQQKLPDSSDEEKEVIFNEIRDISYELMTDVFGNYVIQKYFEYGTETQKNILLDYMVGHIYELSLQMYGCRVVQRALEAIPLEGQLKIIEELKDYVLICAKDQNGNHVIQKSIERVPFDKIGFVLESLGNQIYHLSTHPYGCRVIQRLLEYSSIEDQQKILDELKRFIFYLIQDQYGNYVMQHILERGEAKDREEILKVVLGSVVNFSKHKFASNVIEKCIKYGTQDQRKRILREVMIGNESFEVETVGDDSPLALMMKDQYANYVIQKLVEVFDAKSEEKRLLVTKLRQYLKQISSKNTYGKHLASVEKMIVVAETALVEADNN